MDVSYAKKVGYCITSRRHKMASRIDREDWKEHMAATHASGMAWATGLHKQGLAADYYRRCISKDTITVPENWIKLLPNSGNGPNNFAATETKGD